MAIERINDSQAWADFMKAAQAARTRNTGLQAAVEAHKPAAAATALPMGKTQGVNYAGASAERTATRMLGTRFDAYA